MAAIETFLVHFQRSFDPPLNQTPARDTVFKELPGWSSMQALVLIAMVDTEYDVLLEGEEIQAARTLEDLFQIIVQKVK
jgi:acyl carrier protein